MSTAAVPTPPAGSTPAARTINDNGAWCWFQDERAVVDPAAGVLVVGSVASPEGPDGETRDGNVEVTVVDLAAGTQQVVVLHEHLQSDDHDVPALWHRSDGRWLAVYTKHKSDDLTRWRISEPNDPTSWGPEQVFDWSELTGGRGVTYSNLLTLDGRLYLFARAINDDPCALVSDDDGDTFAFAGKLFTRPKVGYVNGYTRYAQLDDSRIDLITTDHHPRDYDNSTYHGYLAGGALHRSDGSVLDHRAFDGDAPSQVGLTTLIAAGTKTGPDGLGSGEDVLGHGWTVDIRRYPDATTSAVISYRANDFPDEAALAMRDRPVADLRFFHARLDARGEWRIRPLAKAGPGLLPHEQDYSGLVSLDPYDASRLYASLKVDPRTGEALPHYEIFAAATTDDGATWTWTPITEHSDEDNLRPIVAVGDPSRVPLLWFAGHMASSQRYDCRVVLHDTPR